jgi:hypothetical protein
MPMPCRATSTASHRRKFVLLFVLPMCDLKGFLRFLRKTTSTLETPVNAGFACILGKFKYDCLGGRNLGVWFESYLRSHSFSDSCRTCSV